MKTMLGKVTWLLTAIGALNWGLDALGLNIFYMVPFTWMPGIIRPFQLFVGVAGLISLYMYFLPMKK